jgi:hypothetical protein
MLTGSFMLSPLFGVAALTSNNFISAFSFREFAGFFRDRLDLMRLFRSRNVRSEAGRRRHPNVEK